MPSKRFWNIPTNQFWNRKSGVSRIENQYLVTKNGLKHLTKTLAFDLGKFGIRVNNVSPGYMRTDMTKKSWDDPILRQKRTDRTILGRWGESSDLVGSIIFLCSDSSSYITGADLLVDGGWTIKGL